MLASPAHLYMLHLFTHCLPTIICVIITQHNSYVDVYCVSFMFDICYIFLWLYFGLFVYIFLSDCFFYTIWFWLCVSQDSVQLMFMSDLSDLNNLDDLSDLSDRSVIFLVFLVILWYLQESINYCCLHFSPKYVHASLASLYILLHPLLAHHLFHR